jgi:hypothetical protein
VNPSNDWPAPTTANIITLSTSTGTKMDEVNAATLSPQDAKKITMIKWGITILAVAVLAPVAWLAVSGMVGIALAGAIGLVGINVAPVVALKLSNAKYRALDAEKIKHIEKVQQAASENPIETAVTQSQAFKERGVQQLNAITAYGTEVNNFETMTAGFAKKYPDQAARYKQQLDVMKKALQFKQEKYSELQKNIRLMDEQIEFLRANWKMSQALQKANALAGMDTEDPMAQLKTDAAIDSVVNSINRAFAEMDSSVLQDAANAGKGPVTARTSMINDTPGLQAIGNDASPTLLSTSNVNQSVKVQ